MSSINTNVMATIASNSLARNERAMGTAMERLSTGLRINTAKDDAAGLAIAAKMTSQIRGLDQAVRNANDAISLIQTAEGALVEVSNMLQRMRELAVQSATDTNNTTDRTALNAEFVALRSEINRVAQNTQWNGSNVLDKSFASGTGVYKFQVGANAAQTINLTIGNYQTTSTSQGTTAAVTTTTAASGPGAANANQVSTLTIAGTPALGDVISVSVGDKSFVHTVTAGAGSVQTVTEIAAAINTGLGTITGVSTSANAGVLTFTAAYSAADGIPNNFSISASQAGLLGGIRLSDITTQANANSAMAAVSTALATVNTGRSEMGATMNRLSYAADNLTNVSANAQASRSRIQDTDYAAETTELARTQIIAQAGTAMLAQANQAKQTVLALLK
jgi:flagellin